MARTISSRIVARVSAMILVGLIAACEHKAAQVSPQHRLRTDDRLDAIRRAEVWMPTDIPSMDLRNGPKEKGAFEPLAEIDCQYLEKKLIGYDPKFACVRPPDDELKVKYGRQNGEVYGEVAGTRLLWALGFGADHMYSVKVRCRGCPVDPFKSKANPQPEVMFDPAAVERKMPGTELESRPGSGWSWHDLDIMGEGATPAMRTHRSALKLIAVFMQHTDSKDQNQRLLCLPQGTEVKTAADCAKPFMMINDLGVTFGRATLLNDMGPSSVNLRNWSKADIWKDAKHCVGNLAASFGGTLTDPVITEDGRKFLADLLKQLSDKQIRDMFEAARFDLRSGASIDDWIAVFKKKRDEISSVTCPH